MKIYSIHMRVESPLICTEEQIGNVLKHSGISLKGHALRGSFLGLAYNDYPEQVIEESRNPKLVFHPAYPVIEGSVLKPAHPFTYSCKICKDRVEKNPYEALNELEKGKMPEFTACEKGHIFSMKTLGGSLLAKTKDSSKNIDYTSVKSTGINRVLKGSEYAMLYEYVTLPPGAEFRGVISDLGDKMEKLKLTDISKIRIGRGCTRGFGKVSVKVIEEENILEKEFERIYSILQKTNGTIILKALSLTCSLKKGSKGILTQPIPNIPFEWMKPIEVSFLNGNAAITSIEEFAGFSNISKLPTPRLSGAGAGSLFFYRIGKDYWDKASKMLAEKEFEGFNPFSCFGLNILEVFDAD